MSDFNFKNGSSSENKSCFIRLAYINSGLLFIIFEIIIIILSIVITAIIPLLISFISPYISAGISGIILIVFTIFISKEFLFKK